MRLEAKCLIYLSSPTSHNISCYPYPGFHSFSTHFFFLYTFNYLFIDCIGILVVAQAFLSWDMQAFTAGASLVSERASRLTVSVVAPSRALESLKLGNCVQRHRVAPSSLGSTHQGWTHVPWAVGRLPTSLSPREAPLHTLCPSHTHKLKLITHHQIANALLCL